MRTFVAAALTCLTLIGVSYGQDANASIKKFQIAAQPLSEALRAFADQSEMQLIFSEAEVVGAKTEGVDGTLTPKEALGEMLKGTDLRFEFTENNVVVVRREKVRANATGLQRSGGGGIRVAQAPTPSGTGTGASASGQSTGGETSPPQASASSESKLDEIIVTATKRAQNVQDVPVSISVVTAEQMDRRGLVSAEDYLRGIPGVSQTAERAGQVITIRGIETSPSYQNSASGTTVATYFGETPTSNTAGLTGSSNVDIKLVDIERVEVLRGPQGTAFGNSSLGGAVRTIPVAPKTDRIEMKVGAGYSVTSGTGGDNNMLQATGNIPLIADKLAIRASVYRFDDSGFYRNVGASTPSYKAQADARGAFVADEDEVGSTNFTGGRIAALMQFTDDLKLTVSYLKQDTELDGQPLTNFGGYDQLVLPVAPQNTYRGERAGVFDTDIDLINATLEYNLGWGNLLATYSDIKSGSLNALAFSTRYRPTFLSAGSAAERSRHREHSGEIRLATNFEGPWNFLAGLYSEELKDHSYADYWWHGDPAQSFSPGELFLGDIDTASRLKQKAAFAEVSWELLPGVTLTGGARSYDYERSTDTAFTGFFFGNSASSVAGDASGTTYRGNLSYKPNENTLLYAGWSQGFRLGKPQSGVPVGVCDVNGDGVIDGTSLTIASTLSVATDTVDNYEIGTKITLLDRRLTIAADVFRIDWNGLPVRNLVRCGAQDYGYIGNGGAARSEGIEYQATYNLTPALTVDIGGSWLKAQLTKDAPALAPPAFSGDRLPGSPKVNANLGMQYDFQVRGYDVFVRADSIYVGSFYGNLQEAPSTESGGYVKVDTAARIAIRNLSLDLYVRNLTNRDEYTFRGIFSDTGDQFGFRLRPRTIGVQLGYSF